MAISIDQLLILDLTETVVAVLDVNDEIGPFYNAHHLEQLNGENSFKFNLPSNNAKAEFVIEGNLVAFKDLDGDFQLFEIKIIEESHGEIITKQAFCENAVFELLDEIILFNWDRGQSATTILTNILSGTRWTPGTVNVTGLGTVRSEVNNPIESIRKMITSFGKGELKYRVIISGVSITNRYIDFLEDRGSDTGKRFEYGKDIKSIKREVDLTEVKTALYGFGLAEELPTGIRRKRFDNVTWVTPTNPRNKPLGQDFLEDNAAKLKWGRAGGTRHRWGYYENPDQLDGEELLKETNDLLDKVIEPNFSYEMLILDLERLTGLAHEKVRLGDTVAVIDRIFKPEIYLKVKVVEITRYLNEPEKDQVVLGTIRPLSTNDGLIIRDLQDRVHSKEGVWAESAYKNNMITDHSFENIPRAFRAVPPLSPDADQVYEVFKSPPPDGDYGSIFWWQWNGVGLVISSYNDSTLEDYNQLTLFDYQAAVISSTGALISEPYQYVPLNKTAGINGPYTVSCYVSSYIQTVVDGNAIIDVYACLENTTRLNGGLPVKTGTVKLIATEQNLWRRNIVTISDPLPASTVLLEVYIRTDTTSFKYLCDGVQLVPLDKTMTYEPESNLWKMMRNFPGTKLQFPIFLGDATFTGMINLLKPETFRAYSNAVQAFAINVFTKVFFQVESWDLRNKYNNITSIFTASENGYYSLCTGVRIDNPIDQELIALAVFINGVQYEKIDAKTCSGVGDVQMSGSTILQLSQFDSVEIQLFTNQGCVTRFGSNETHFKMYKIG